jgi:hypothetical protein
VKIFRIIILLLGILINGYVFSQKISVLTCSQGNEIYSTFGHSAFRYFDSSKGIDWVYNYGLFVFSDPNFIPKFCQGKLDYMVGRETMNDFMSQYVYQQRSIKEQVLNLTPSQVDTLYRFLEWNILDENKYYRYDFLYNNCATKIIDVLDKKMGDVKWIYTNQNQATTFRGLINEEAKNQVPWLNWGMDILLGSVVDQKINPKDYCFLPKNVAHTLSTSLHISSSEPLVIDTKVILDYPQKESSASNIPFYLLGGGCILLFYFHYRYARFEILTRIVYFVMGIFGCIILYEWFFTEHWVTKNNGNLAWLHPLWFFLAIGKKQSIWYSKVMYIIIIGLVFQLGTSVLDLQEYHPMTSVLALTLLVYFWYIFKDKKHNVSDSK